MKKPYVKDEKELASLIAIEEGGKSEASIGDVRQALRLLKVIDLRATIEGRRSPLTMLRKIVLAEAKKKTKK